MTAFLGSGELARRCAFALLVAASCLLPAGPAAAQPAAVPEAGWRLHLTGYGWFASTAGIVGAGGVTGKVDDGFLDTLRQTDSLIGLMGRAELRRGRLGLFVDGQHTRLGYDDVRVGPLTIDAESRLTTVEFGAAWQVAGAAAADPPPGSWALDVLGGGRWTRARNELRFAVGVGGDSTADWVDPFVGLRLRGRLSERWEYALRGDVGGGVGGSRFAWQAAATLGYGFELFGLQATALAGYRALSQDYESRRLTYDVTLHGPLIGLNLRF
jgi:hypothetical protein